MIRVLLDTNVIFSMAVYPAPWTRRLAYELGKNSIQLFITDYSIAELERVISKKAPNRASTLRNFLSLLPFEKLAVTANVSPQGYPYIRDVDDFPILAAAIDAKIDVLVSGDKDFLAVETDKMRILSPNEFLDYITNTSI